MLSAAQEYHGGLLYDIKGPVKEFKLKTDFKACQKKVKFTRDGMIKGSTYAYDAQGLPTGMSINFGKKYSVLSIQWEEGPKVTEITLRDNFYRPSVVTYTPGYYPDGLLKSYRWERTETTKDGEEKGWLLMEYSSPVYDEHGNWIRRHVVATGEGNGQSVNTEFDEERVIRYYTE